MASKRGKIQLIKGLRASHVIASLAQAIANHGDIKVKVYSKKGPNTNILETSVVSQSSGPEFVIWLDK